MMLKEENKKLYRLIAGRMGETENVEEDWKTYWADKIDHERVNDIFRELLSGALIAEGICAEGEAEKHINQMLAASS